MNTIYVTTSPIELIPVRTKIPDLTPRTQPTELSTRPKYFSKRKLKAYVPEEPESDP